MLHTLLIEDAMGQKLAVMEFFLRQPEGCYSINTICCGLVLSHRTAATLIAEINEDLRDLSGYEFVARDRKIHWCPEAYHHNSYIQYLIRQSLPYQFVLRTLTHPEDTFANFCDRHFLSQSTTLRKLRPLKDLLQRFGLQVRASKMQLVGPEVSLRLFYTTYLWLGHHGEDLKRVVGRMDGEEEFAQTLTEKFTQFMHPKEITLLLAVHRLRYEQGHWLAERPYPDIATPGFSRELARYGRFITDQSQRKLHLHSLTAMFFLTPLYFEARDFRGQQLLRYFHQLPKENPLKALALEFEDYFFQDMVHLEAADYLRLSLWRINFYTTLLRHFLFPGELPLISDLTRHIPTTERPLFEDMRRQQKRFFTKIAKRQRYPWLAHGINAFVEDCSYALFPNYKDCFQRCLLKVGIVTSPDYYIQQLVRNLLRQFAFIESSFITSPDEDYDFFVTTFENLLPKNLQKPYFVMDLTQEINCQTQLFQALWEAYYQKALSQGGLFHAKTLDNP